MELRLLIIDKHFDKMKWLDCKYMWQFKAVILLIGTRGIHEYFKCRILK